MRSISRDLEVFHQEHKNLQLYLDETVTNEDLDEDSVITLILSEETPKDFQHYESVLASTKYLCDGYASQEDLIYEIYEPAIHKISATAPFTGFKKYHRDLFLRLKLRAIE